MAFTKDAIRDLHAWMHGCLDVVCDHALKVPPPLLVKELPGFGQPTVLAQLTHVLAAESGWVRRLQRLPVEPPAPGRIAGVADVREAKRAVMAATLAYLDALTTEELNSELSEYPKDWVGPRSSPSFILLHIVTHAFHHKGQMVAMLRLLGYPAPDTDMQRE